MIRQIIKIDENKCNGCGLCKNACHEGAIDIIDGKAKLVRVNFCDGFGDCLPNCPMDAISFIETEAPAYDEEAVKKAKIENMLKNASCPGSKMKEIKRDNVNFETVFLESALTNWPIQIKLAPIVAPYFSNSDLLIAADCTAYSYANFHNDFMKEKVTLIACPKLDNIDYSEKLTEIFKANDIKTITLARMEVPCCGGLERAIKVAIENSKKEIPLNISVISIEGKIINDK